MLLNHWIEIENKNMLIKIVFNLRITDRLNLKDDNISVPIEIA